MSEWQPIKTAPKDEANSFLVFVPVTKPVEDWDVIIQVSWFQGCLYPDSKQACIDLEDAITTATHWMPLPAAPDTQNDN